MEGNEGGTDEGHGIVNLHSDIVQTTVIDTGTERAILLPNEEEPLSYGKREWADDPSGEGFPNIILH